MSLEPGARLGPYAIVSRIGAGGMGEVYRASDTRLDRSVAIKILPAEFAGDAQFRQRFEREARMISQLNHSHICSLFDVGQDAGHDYLVMELVEGETLADRVAKGPMPADDVMQFGIQIAEALDAAHRQNIVHRDLKPGNIMLTKSGVKLLDFGLAKSALTAVAPTAGTAFATAAKPLTQEGTIIGTFQYMAPEQLEGAEADPRTDIFAFGAVLYEMATGQRAFEGKTRTSLIAAIVSSQPKPISSLQPLTPPALEHVVERCLEKEPDARWQTARDIAEELKWISAKGSQIGVAAPIAAHRRSRERLSWSLYPLIAILGAAAAWGVIRFRSEPLRVVETSINPPDKSEYAFAGGEAPAISPDGSRIAFVAQTAGERRIWVRPLSGGAAQPLAGTESASALFWSPDSRMIGFFSGGKMKKIDASGGPAQALCDVTNPRGGTWSRDGVIVFAPGNNGPLYRVADSGGVPAEVTKLDPTHENDHRWPWFLPDGRHFLYLADMRPGQGSDDGAIMVGSIDEPLKKKLVTATSSVAWSRAGYLLYWRDRSLIAQKLDVKTLEVGRDVIPIAENVALNGKNSAMFSVSDHGELIYQTGEAHVLSQLAWFDATGKRLDNVGKPADIGHLQLSHDGRRVAAAIRDPGSRHVDIWIESVTRGTATRLTFGPADNIAPVWSADDTRITYASNANGPSTVLVKRSSGTGAEETVFASSTSAHLPTSWSPDGATILTQSSSPGKNGFDIGTISMLDKKAGIFLQTTFFEGNAQFSPDGRWVAYQSDDSGKSQVYVLSHAGAEGKWQISTDGGSRARWSHDGRQLFYLSPDYKLMAVDIGVNGGSLEAGTPRLLFAPPMRQIFSYQYDVAPDGRFIVNCSIEQEHIAPITLVQNWTAALKK